MIAIIILGIVIAILGIIIEWAFHPMGRITKDDFVSSKRNFSKMSEEELRKYIL
jgi:hypothetical protein